MFGSFSFDSEMFQNFYLRICFELYHGKLPTAFGPQQHLVQIYEFARPAPPFAKHTTRPRRAAGSRQKRARVSRCCVG